MESVFKLEKQIEIDWINDPDKNIGPYEFLLDKVGEVTTDPIVAGDYMRSLHKIDWVSDFSEAISYGYDDLRGFAFFYLVTYLRKETNLLARLHQIKHGSLPHQHEELIKET
jgi:hypothetical protein